MRSVRRSDRASILGDRAAWIGAIIAGAGAACGCLLVSSGFAITLHVAPPLAGAPPGDGSVDRPFRDLTQAVGVARALSERDDSGAQRSMREPAAPVEGVRVLLAPGHYELIPRFEVEPTCGNCADPNTPVPFSFGLRVGGRRIRLEGAGPGPSVIHTRAGYGILFQDCRDCALRRVTVTDGIRDPSGMATDAGIVVQRSSVRIEQCEIRNNLGDPAAIEKNIVGIAGIAGREGSRLQVVQNRIRRNSWDGIALYRDAEAEILGNVIDGIDLATGRTTGGGRGVGIGVTWNARAVIRGNLVTRYWKGIGLFVDAQGVVEENVIERVATWGLSLWDAGTGRPQGYFRHNAVDSTGACGAMIARASAAVPEPGYLLDNAFSRTGQNPKYDSGEPYCLQTAVALHAAPDPFRIEGNLFFDNREPDGVSGSGDLDAGAFRARVRDLCARLSAWTALRESRFLREFGGRGFAVPGLGRDNLGWPEAGGDPAGDRTPRKEKLDARGLEGKPLGRPRPGGFRP